ncbi:uncharacterized protein LOC113099560 [Carassius auratus]|uniref:Uncharacterized protein LOC113099560 n=1 Tax=Carassius auratus TaxID=7957 RepID=A0A6P6PGK2_CARAU|nr:uncharacterized protein LOC113099560 [Carassius auratus]
MGRIIEFSSGDTSADLSQKHKGPQSHTAKKNLDSIFKELEHKIISELKSFKRLLSPDYPECSERDRYDDEGHNRVREGLLKITLLLLRKMNQTDLADTLQTKLMSVYQQKLRSRLQDKYQRLSEGLSNHGDSTRLNEIYTELYITEGGSGEVNNEHEVRQIETVSRRPETQGDTNSTAMTYFKPSPGQDKPIRTVLTKGVAGIGKTARKTILSLGKLAFEQLEKGNLIFYEEDLKESGIDVREVSVYSGVCTQIFREESGLQLGKRCSALFI